MVRINATAILESTLELVQRLETLRFGLLTNKREQAL